MTEPGRGYYGLPIVKAHAWKDWIGWYFFTGGVAGGSATIAALAQAAGRPSTARHARWAAMAGLVPSPVLLIADLGRPGRFANMLRVFKPTSPMSVGSWLLAVFGPALGASWLLGELDAWPVLQGVAAATAGAVGPAIGTYTGVLVADTATPAWHEARGELPVVFAASATASSGALTAMCGALAGTPDRGPARVATVGAIAEVVATKVMTHRLGELNTYSSDHAAHRLERAATILSGAGAVVVGTAGRRRMQTVLGAAMVAAGSACLRLAVLRAGSASANDPSAVLTSQRRATARPVAPTP